MIKMKTVFTIAGLVFLLVFSSVLFGKGKKVYNVAVKLEKVERTPALETEIKVMDGQVFESAPIAVLWSPVPQGFRFRLYNRKDQKVTILWNECRFYDERNRSHVVTHHGVKSQQPSDLKGMKPTVVEAQGKVQDVLFPYDSDYLIHEKELTRFGKGNESSPNVNNYNKRGLRTRPIFLDKIPEKMANKLLKKKRKKTKNKELDMAGYITSLTYSMEMPLLLGETRYVYRFYFRSHLMADKK
ncbi:MAG: hypothetical protein GY765_08515 [bacterium]|nr:hypothetical protein [bacterium]